MKPSLRVLLVEDEAVIAMTTEDLLEELGHRVAATASTLDEALARIDDTSFDLALLDVNLAGRQSLPAAARLAAQAKRFAFTTGYGSAIPGEDLPAVPIVKKPYDRDALARVIAELTD